MLPRPYIKKCSRSVLNVPLPTYDGNGNVASLVRSSDGVVAASYEYSPFGELLRCSQPASGGYAKENPFRFSTKFTDDETGLVYYGARFFDPRNGRFLNRDPIAEQGGLNLYGFCGNDGVNGVDYMGMDPIVMEPFIVTGTKIGATFGPVGAVVGGVIGAVVGIFSSKGIFGKLFGGGGGGAAKAPPKPATITRPTAITSRGNPDLLNPWRYEYLGDDIWAEVGIAEGGMLPAMEVSASRLPSLASMFMSAMEVTNPAIALARGMASQYRANVELGGGRFNAINMTFNPAYMAMSGFNETFSGLGMDAHDLGQQLTGWGRTRALGKGVIGAVGTVTAATGLTAAGSSMFGRVAAQSAAARPVSLGTRFQRFFYDNRPFSTIRREYWRMPYGPPGRYGPSLDHWLFPNASRLPQGIRNAGFNLVELPPFIRTPFGGLNQWMGMSSSPWTTAARVSVTASIPASLGAGFWGGMEVGEWLFGAESVP